MALRGTSITSLSLCACMAMTSLLTGCSASFSPSETVDAEEVPIGPIQGQVHGGQSPISGASIYLYAAGTTGYGSAATSLIKTSPLPAGVSIDSNGNGYVTADANGNFALSGDYTCTQGTQVYMVAVGGNSGSGTNNPYIVQMAGLGECPSQGNLAAQDPYVTINELSTVAFAYAMAPFVSSTNTDAYHIGSTSTTAGKLAIHNAMANVANLVSLAYGQAQSSMPGNSNVTMPTAKISHLANLLATCVNTSGLLGIAKVQAGNGGGYTYTLDPCGKLFNDTLGVTESGSSITTTADEAQAIFNIALNPTTKVTPLYNLVGSTTAFLDLLTAAPTDWTLPIVYKNAVSVFAEASDSTTGYTGGPFNIAIDASGNAWIGDRTDGVVEISTTGTVSSWNHGFGRIKGVAIAPNGNIWAADYLNNNVYIMDTSGDVLSTLTNGVSSPAAIAFNNAGNAYIVDEAPANVTVYNPTGTSVLAYEVAMGDLYTTNGVTAPAWIAIDANGNAWISNFSGGTVGELTATYATGYIHTNNVGGNYWLGFDSSSNMWIGDFGKQRLDVGTPNGSGSYTIHSEGSGSGLTTPFFCQIDGAGTVWMPNLIAPPNNPPSTSASVLSAYSQTSGTSGAFLGTANGFSTGGTGGAVAAAVDLSGNVWVANEDGTVSELIGLGAPTASPLTPANAGTKP